MVFKWNFWLSAALALLLSFLVWFWCSERVEASSSGPYSVTYEGIDFYYYVGDFNLYCESTTNYSRVEFDFAEDNDVVTFLYFKSNTLYYWCCNREFNEINLANTLYKNDGTSSVVNRNLTYNTASAFGTYSHLLDTSFYPTSFNEIVAWEFVCSEDFIDSTPIEAIWSKGESDSDFSLRSPRGFVEEEAFHAYWGFPAREDLEGYENMPLRVRFYVEDTDSGEVIDFYYPKVLESIMKPTEASYSVNDLELHIPISDLGELPTNYRIQYVELYPYYFVDDVVLQENLRKGTKSVIKLNYDGSYKTTVEVSPDDVYDEENTDDSIMGMISNFFSRFFSNFLDMLKRAIIPSSDDLWSLLNDMNDWFSERLGFIWYPFDLAFRVVEAFHLGEANNIIKVPAIHLNMLGGITLYEGGEFDIDPIGIFDYIKFFTSAIMACSVVSLAKVKWDEWIGGRTG